MELSNYISPLEFEDLSNGEKKVILKRVYKKVFVTPGMPMTLNGTICRLFTFEVMIVNDDAVVREKKGRRYDCACPKNIVVREERQLLWDVMDEWVKETETLNVTNEQKRRLHPFKMINTA